MTNLSERYASNAADIALFQLDPSLLVSGTPLTTRPDPFTISFRTKCRPDFLSKGSDQVGTDGECEPSVELCGLILENLSPVVLELLWEVNYATPKQVVFFDSRPLEPKQAAKDGYSTPIHWCDAWQHENAVMIFINPDTANQEVLAHELGHAWVEFFLDYEDHRMYVDGPDKTMSFLVSSLQSQLIDIKIFELLRARGGLNMDSFVKDYVISAAMAGRCYELGIDTRNKYEDIFTVHSFQVPFIFRDLFEFADRDWEILCQADRSMRKLRPDLGRLADRLRAAIEKHGYETTAQLVRSVDASLEVLFNYLGLRFDPEKHLRRVYPRTNNRDKLADFLPGAPVPLKHRILREAILRRQPFLASHQSADNRIAVKWLENTRGFTTQTLPRISTAAAMPAQMHELLPPGASLIPFLPAEKSVGIFVPKAL